MRIFKQLVVDFKSDLPFKDTLDYIEEVFGKLGIAYDSMGFMFSGGDTDRIVEKYPALTKYIQTHDEYGGEQRGAMSSAETDENGNYTLRVDKSEHQILHELVKKTPRPYSFGAISVFLDNVRWFSDINTTPCFVRHPPNAYYPQSYMSNCVILAKQFDHGKKFNPVWFMIEVGDEKTGIIDISELEGKLSAIFGKPFGTRYILPSKYEFYFTDEEQTYLAKQHETFAKTYDPLIRKLRDSVNNAEGIQHIKKADPFNRPPGLSLVKALKKILPPKQYNHHRPGGLFVAEKKNENNHTFALGCLLSPMWKHLQAEIVISGHNFKYATDLNNFGGKGFEAIAPNTQEELEYHVANLAAALKKAEEGLRDELLRLYGKSVV